MEVQTRTSHRTVAGLTGAALRWSACIGWLALLLFLLAVLLWMIVPAAPACASYPPEPAKVDQVQPSLMASEPQTLTLTAHPTTTLANGLSFCTLSADVEYPLGGPADDGTVVVFSTTLGTFPGGLMITPQPTGVMTIEAESNVVITSGSWFTYPEPLASGGEVIYSCVPSDRVTYEFTATAISVVFQKQFNAGIARVYLDGEPYSDFDTYFDDGSGTGKLYQQEEPIASGLPYAPHSLEVEVTAMKNVSATAACTVIDAFRVYGFDRNGAYLTESGVSTITLTSIVTPGMALVTACAEPACDSTTVTFQAPGPRFVYLPIVLKNLMPPPPGCDEAIQNGSFEDATAWVLGMTPRQARYTTDEHVTGSRSVFLGLKPAEVDILSYSSVRQPITLPVNTVTATLSFRFHPVSDLDVEDRQECLILDRDEHLLAILMQTNLNIGGWVKRTYDISAFAGQTINVYFNAYNDGDGDGVTGFYLDDVSVQVCTSGEVSPPPLPPPPETAGCYPVLLTTAGVGQAPRGVAVNSAAHRLYVANHDQDTLSVIDSSTYALLASPAVGDGPNGVAYNPANNEIYVANGNGNSVTVLRASDYGLVKTIGVGLQPNGLAVNEGTNRVYVANHDGGTVSVIDGATNSVIQTVAVGPEPAMVAVNSTTNKAYVSLHGIGKVAVINGAGTAAQIDIFSAGPYGIAVDTVRNLVYVATIDTFRIAVVDGLTGSFLGWAEIRRLPGEQPVPLRMIAVNPLIATSGHIYVTTAGADGGWDRVLLLPKGWPELFARAYALDLNEPQEGIAFEPATLRVFVTSRSDDLVAVYQDGDPSCPSNFSLTAEYRIVICMANPDGTCQQPPVR
jgi:YVTN family beta-propeller protein